MCRYCGSLELAMFLSRLISDFPGIDSYYGPNRISTYVICLTSLLFILMICIKIIFMELWRRQIPVVVILLICVPVRSTMLQTLLIHFPIHVISWSLKINTLLLNKSVSFLKILKIFSSSWRNENLTSDNDANFQKWKINADIIWCIDMLNN